MEENLGVDKAAFDTKLVNLVASCWDDPLKFVETMFPWGSGELVGDFSKGPDEWQRDVMKEITRRIRSGDESHIKLAVASGHHIGKTCLIAWVIMWFMSTRPNCSVVITAGSGDQLKGTAWRELAKWHRLALNSDWFEMTATQFSAKENKLEWNCQARTWSDEDPHKMAGKHAGKDKVLYIFDEASTIPDEIWEVVEGGTQDKRMIMIAFGNPVRNVGKFRECFRDFKDVWWTKQVDSRDVRIANKGEINNLIRLNGGEDSDYVKMRVRGIFPDSTTEQFISLAVVEAAMDRTSGVETFDNEPLIMGVDVGVNHDDTVCVLRKGRKIFDNIARFKNPDITILAERVGELIKSQKPDYVCIDCAGIGYAVWSQLHNWGYKVEKVLGSEASSSPNHLNKRIDMWWDMKQWMKDGSLPRIDSLKKELTAINQHLNVRTGKMMLDTKDDIRKVLGGKSPDTADAISLTFARNFAKMLARKPITVDTEYSLLRNY